MFLSEDVHNYGLKLHRLTCLASLHKVYVSMLPKVANQGKLGLCNISVPTAKYMN